MFQHIDSKLKESNNSKSYQVNEDTRIVHESMEVTDLDVNNTAETDLYQKRFLYKNRPSRTKSQELKSNRHSRATRIVKDSEASGSCASRESSKTNNSDLASVQELKHNSYSFRACADLFQRYDALKHANKNSNHQIKVISAAKNASNRN